jgi:hypothetical protein
VQGARVKRWKVGCLNRRIAKQHEALIKADLMRGLIKSSQVRIVTFNELGEMYLKLEEVKRLRSYRTNIMIVRLQLIPVFGGMALTEITPEHVERYSAHRTRRNGQPASLQTINNDHTQAILMLNLPL